MSGARSTSQGSKISHAPLIAVILGLTMAAAPVFPKVSPWGIALFFAACGARVFMNRRAGRLPSLQMKVALFGLGLAAVSLSHGSLVGIEPGLTILLLLVSLKLLETNNVRDFQVITLLGYFLALCDLFFSQDLTLWLYVALTFTVLTAALILFHSGSRGSSYGRSLRLAVTMLLQAAPVMAILFLFFPRTYSGFRFQFSQSLLKTNGMSDRLSPGSVSALALNDQVAFRADFPDGQVPPMTAMYWRGAVLWHCAGMTWEPGPRLNLEGRTAQLAGPAVRQRISLQPHGEHWLFALDRPATEVHGASYSPGGYLQSARRITNPFHYEVVSRPENRELTLPPDQRLEALRKPARISPAVNRLVADWRAAAADDRELVRMGMAYFREERFSYTLRPGVYQEEGALDEFLFSRREGFCEHYAAAFATLMRVAGIPSRVVIGYQGGEFNSLGHYVIVRQSEAHAWCEVWIRESGWQRVDPTDMIAPDRIGSGLASYLEAHPADRAAAARQSSAMIGWREVFREVMLAWDSINYQWDLRVLNFDEENQRSFLYSLGLGDARWPQILTGAAPVIGLVLAGIALLLRRPRGVPVDEISRWYARFCGALESGGIQREPAEGPRDFGERAAAQLPAYSSQIRAISDLYIRSRYAPGLSPSKEFIRAARAFPAKDN